jgi:hypothetical protein
MKPRTVRCYERLWRPLARIVVPDPATRLIISPTGYKW